MKDICMETGCTLEATCVPRLNVPATDQPVDAHKLAGIIASYPLCDKHLGEFKPERLLREESKPLFRKMLAERGHQPPDFDRAFVTKCALDDSEYLALKEAREQRRLAHGQVTGKSE